MEKNKYVKEVEKKLVCRKEKKAEICKDLISDIEAALESGEEWADVEKRLGTPTELAAEFNENLPAQDKKKSRNKTVFIILAVLAVFIIAAVALIVSRFPKTAEIGSSGLFDEAVVHERAVEVIRLAAEENWDVLLQEYSASALQDAVSGEDLDAAKKLLGTWGEYEKITSEYMQEITASGTTMAVVQMVALFEEKSITFTLTFDQDMKLAGIYMK